MMIGLLKNSSCYPNVRLQPMFRVSTISFLENNLAEINEHMLFSDETAFCKIIDRNKFIEKCISDIDLTDYADKKINTMFCFYCFGETI